MVRKRRSWAGLQVSRTGKKMNKKYFQKISQMFSFKSTNPELEEVVSSGDEQIVLSSDTGPAIRMAFWVVVVAFGGFVLWAWFAPLDEGATSFGTVVVEYHRRPIQHMTGGIAEEVLVKEGESVNEGQVLIRLVQTNAKAQMQIYAQQVAQFNRQINATKSMVDEGYFPLMTYQEYVRQRDEAALKEKIAKEELDRTEIKSPISGAVLGLNVAKGGVVSPGAKLMEIVPNDEVLVVEAKIMPQLIDRIHKGLKAQVRFSALNQRTTPIVYGEVEWVSADKISTTDPMMQRQIQGDGYYTAKVRLYPEELKKLGDQELYPGMPADVIIKTGRRNFFSYLMKPFTDRAALSLQER
jgi:membrane fusion protein, protease secretion system